MADERLRKYEKDFRESGTPESQKRYGLELARSGQIEESSGLLKPIYPLFPEDEGVAAVIAKSHPVSRFKDLALDLVYPAFRILEKLYGSYDVVDITAGRTVNSFLALDKEEDFSVFEKFIGEVENEICIKDKIAGEFSSGGGLSYKSVEVVSIELCIGEDYVKNNLFLYFARFQSGCDMLRQRLKADPSVETIGRNMDCYEGRWVTKKNLREVMKKQFSKLPSP